MRKFKIKSKQFGLIGSIGKGIKNTAGSIMSTGGKLMSGGLGKTAGFLAGVGAMGTGAAIGASLAGPVGGLIGGLATPFVTKKATEAVGTELKNAGQDLKMNAV